LVISALQNVSGVDFLREMISLVAERLMALEFEALCGAAQMGLLVACAT